MSELQTKWDAIYRQRHEATAAEVLAEQHFLLPKQGQALDLACGLGGNALLLAEAGLDTEAWDVSPVALDRLQQQAATRRLNIATRQCHIDAASLANRQFDVIVISRFLDRSLCNAIMATLKPEGLLFYQTFTRTKLAASGPSNPDYLLDRNELLQLFAPLAVVYYQEHARIGDWQYGDRNEARFIGQKL